MVIPNRTPPVAVVESLVKNADRGKQDCEAINSKCLNKKSLFRNAPIDVSSPVNKVI